MKQTTMPGTKSLPTLSLAVLALAYSLAAFADGDYEPSYEELEAQLGEPSSESTRPMTRQEIVDSIYDACAVGGCNPEKRIWEYEHPGQPWPGDRPSPTPRRTNGRITQAEKDGIYDACAVGGCNPEKRIWEYEHPGQPWRPGKK